MAEAYAVPFLGEIPLEPQIGQNADEGMPIAAVGDDVQRRYFGQIVDSMLASSVIRLSKAEGVS